MFAASKTAAVSGAAPDAQFNYVTMLLHGDGTNGAQNNTFIDSSSNNFTITRNGNTTQGSFSPYGSNWSNYFGSGNYLTAPAANIVNFGTGDFIVEAFFNCSTTSGNNKIFDNYNGNNNPNATLLLNLDGAGVVSWYAGQTSVIASSSTFSVGVWNYVVVSRVSGTTKMFLNGTQVGSVSDTRTYAAGYTNVGIGAEANGGGSTFNGYISNLRVVKGSGVTSSTVPTTPLTAITNTVLLTCQSNRYIDNSSNAYTITATGSPSVQRFNPFGTSTAYSTSMIGGSGYFDGTGDYLQTSGTVGIASSAFTICCWFYPLSSSVIGLFDSGPNQFNVFRNYPDNTIEDQNTAGSVSFAGTYKPYSWNWMCITKSGTSFTVYVNGTSVGTGTCSATLTESSFTIGGINNGEDGSFNGYLSDFQVLNTAINVAVPTAPITNASGKTYLLNFQNGAIYDNAMMNDLETVGNAQISTSVVKYGTGSMYFDGTGDYLVGNGGQGLGGDFTIEAWVYAVAFTGNARVIVDTRDVWSTSTGLNFYFNDTGNLIMYLNGGDRITSATAYSTSTWYFVTLARSGSTITMYVNGTSVGTYTYSTALTDKSITIGTAIDARNTGTGWHFNGYIDDLRITKGYARYTTNFTPPTAAFSNTGPN